jgi:tetraacyldisaccharide 4'-kinase
MTLRPVLAPGLATLAVAYEGIVRVRNMLYDRGLLPSHKLLRPVISIGNLTVGGTGKTPLVIHIARLLVEWGYAPVLLSRGYGRQSSRAPLSVAPWENPPPGAKAIGDEPALMRRRIPSLWLGISKDRLQAARQLDSLAPQAVFLLDDGFQHRRLGRDLDIVLIDISQPLRSNRILPWGTLREPVSSLTRSQLIVCNGLPGQEGCSAVEAEVARIHPSATVFHCSQEIDRVVFFDDWQGEGARDVTASIRGALLVAAIANPSRFQRDALARGIPVLGCEWFRDHHWFSSADWRACAEAARKAGADILLITEKDAARISRPPEFPLAVAVQRTTIFEAERFEQRIEHVCRHAR